MRLRQLSTLLLAASLLSLAPSCKTADGPGNKPNGGQVTPGQGDTPQEVDFQAAAMTKQISLGGASATWQVTSTKTWVKASQIGQTLKIDVEANDDAEVREAELRLTSSAGKRTIKIRQLGQAPAILVDKSVINQVPAAGGGITFEITTNVKVEVKLPDWIKSPARAMRRETHSYVVQPNTTGKERMANIEIIQTGVAKDPVKLLVAVQQLGTNNYVPGSTDQLPEDEQIKVVSGTASSVQPGAGIERSFDGDLSTIYHSAWANGGSDYFPITLTYNFAEATEVDYLVYYPRQDTSHNGYFDKGEIQSSEDGTTFTKLMDFDFRASSTATRVVLPKRTKAKSFRFIVRKGHGDGQGFASCAEMQFFRRSTKAFDYTTIFADEVCSELKPSVTDEQIAQISDPFFRNLAFYLKQGKYNKEFRVADFKPWLLPTVVSGPNKTNPYSLLDNPTGIAVEKGQDLIVFVGDLHQMDARLSLRVQNLDKPGGDGFNDPVVYPLSRGMNRIKMQKSGLAYVLYHASDVDALKRFKPVRIHFATGTVNGYYDSQDPKLKDRWHELINKAPNKHFDVLGKYCHLTFETQAFRQYTPQGRDITNTYDSIVYNEWVLHGLVKYKREPQNRMYLHVMYHAFMYATWYHTAYVNSTQQDILNPDKMRNPASQGAAWGPSHEIGHMNQTRPGLLWAGMTEVTVNIPSEYITTYVFGQPSRLQVEKLELGNNRYTKGFNNIFVGNVPFYRAGDVFVNLIPFWQLELYFGKALGRTPRKQADGVSGFYPDLYQYFRDHDSPNTVGEQQTEFAFAASKVGGVDLTRFFERWGFFHTVDNGDIDDYGKSKINISAARVASVKSRIKALNLKPLDVALEYITDHNAYLYAQKPAIVAGAAAKVSGRTVTITGWKHVVAFEVYDGTKLVYAADATHPAEGGAVFTMDSDWKASYSIKAVSAGNDRVDVPRQ